MGKILVHTNEMRVNAAIMAVIMAVLRMPLMFLCTVKIMIKKWNGGHAYFTSTHSEEDISKDHVWIFA